MARALYLLALLFSVASAFVAPVQNVALVRPGASAPKMMPVEMVTDLQSVSTFAESSNMIASTARDFGGYLFPVFGIIGLAAFILYLAPPLKDD